MKSIIRKILKEIAMPDLITKGQILSIHDELLDRFGGIKGFRDESQLDYAIEKMDMNIFGHESYPDIYSKLASFLQTVITIHPFNDGNKRTAFHVVKDSLISNGKSITVGYNQARPFLAKIASQNMEVEEIAEWLRSVT
jgi:death-on-curing protein